VAATQGLGAVLTGRQALGFLALLFLNLALGSLWIDQELYDPSYYGVPAGLSLLFVTEVAKQRLQPPMVPPLRALGLLLVYGSVAAQVLRVDTPLHALVLFGLGLVTVLGALWRRRNDFLLGGALAILLDVMVYLFKHGFQRDFVGSFLLVSSGATLLGIAILRARRRLRSAG
jgi:hypothetical protein